MIAPIASLVAASLLAGSAWAATPDSFEGQIKDASVTFTKSRAKVQLAKPAPKPAPKPAQATAADKEAAMIQQAMDSVATVVVSVPVPVGIGKPKGGILASVLGRDKQVEHMDKAVGLGTAWVARADGMMVTNNHVVAERKIGDKVFVQFRDHINLEAEVLAKNPKKDLALLRLVDPAQNRPALPLGDSRKLREGKKVVVIGSPLGLRHTVTSGGFSGERVDISMYQGRMLQTDAAINGGNSGGPMFDGEGRVVGVNFMKLAGVEIDNIGFAIPVEYVKQALAQYDAQKKLSNAVMGAQFEKASWAPREALPKEQAGQIKHEQGLWLEGVVKDCAAEKAGLREGDRIVSIGGAALPKASLDAQNAMRVAIWEKSPGESLKLVYARGGFQYTVTVILDEEKSDE